MVFLGLPEVESCVAKSDVGIIVFLRRTDIFTSLDVVALGVADHKSIRKIIKITGNGFGADFHLIDTCKSIGDSARIGQRADSGRNDIKKIVKNIFILNIVTLQNILQIDVFK